MSDEKQDPPTDTNDSNNAASSRNYYAPSLNEDSNEAENGVGRILIPFHVDGIQQIFHIVPTVVTDPKSISGPRTGFGTYDSTIPL